ncbi:unnamed protein product [Merluccius merluccius]
MCSHRLLAPKRSRWKPLHPAARSDRIQGVLPRAVRLGLKRCVNQYTPWAPPEALRVSEQDLIHPHLSPRCLTPAEPPPHRGHPCQRDGLLLPVV